MHQVVTQVELRWTTELYPHTVHTYWFASPIRAAVPEYLA